MAGSQMGLVQVSALLLSLVTNPTVIAIVCGILAAFGFGFQQRRAGAAKERAKQAKREERARGISDEVENDIGTIPPDRRREDLGKWSKG